MLGCADGGYPLHPPILGILLPRGLVPEQRL
jgi:hypothetical protein